MMIKDKRRERVYVSGPITGIDNYMDAFKRADEILSDKDVVNPARICKEMPNSFEHEEYMTICMDLIAMCDSVYMLKGWEKSIGANREHGYAMGKGMRIYYEE